MKSTVDKIGWKPEVCSKENFIYYITILLNKM